MDYLYFWGVAIVVGLASSILIPSKKLSSVNRKMREKIPGMALTIMYIVFWILMAVAGFFLCTAFNASVPVRNAILGVILGLFIGFIPIVDRRNAEDDGEKK